MYIEQKQNSVFKPQGNTTLSAEETNQQNTELQNLITAGGLTPSASTLTQVRDAVQNIVNTSANYLQQQIDAITSASDVFDVVGTYAELQAYDKTTVPINDIIKVLQDSTHNNAATYYRLVEESGGGTDWQYIGSEGPYYTKSEIDTDFATKAELPSIATTSQAGLVKPDGSTILIDQNGTISVSGVQPDGISITPNTNSELQAIGVINQNNTSSAIKYWTGTKQQYDAIQNKDANTIYNVTDETPSSAGAYIVETYHSGYDYYRVWSDGFCEQGGRIDISQGSYVDKPLLKAYNNTYYLMFFSHSDLGTAGQAESYMRHVDGSTVRIGNGCGNFQTFCWKCEGYIS